MATKLCDAGFPIAALSALLTLMMPHPANGVPLFGTFADAALFGTNTLTPLGLDEILNDDASSSVSRSKAVAGADANAATFSLSLFATTTPFNVPLPFLGEDDAEALAQAASTYLVTGAPAGTTHVPATLTFEGLWSGNASPGTVAMASMDVSVHVFDSTDPLGTFDIISEAFPVFNPDGTGFAEGFFEDPDFNELFLQFDTGGAPTAFDLPVFLPVDSGFDTVGIIAHLNVWSTLPPNSQGLSADMTVDFDNTLTLTAQPPQGTVVTFGTGQTFGVPDQPVPVSEPGSALLLGTGIAVLLLFFAGPRHRSPVRPATT